MQHNYMSADYRKPHTVIFLYCTQYVLSMPSFTALIWH